MRIDFPIKSAFDFDRQAVAFPAEVAGADVRCFVSVESLRDHFEVDETCNFVTIFEKNRTRIQNVARRMLEAGATGNIVIKTSHF